MRHDGKDAENALEEESWQCGPSNGLVLHPE